MNLRNSLSTEEGKISTFLKFADFFGFPNDDKCLNSKATTKFINLITINRFYVIAFYFMLALISQKSMKTESEIGLSKINNTEVFKIAKC